MLLEMITIGAIGVTYLTGDKNRKEKMRKIGSSIVDVTGKTKELVKKKRKAKLKIFEQ